MKLIKVLTAWTLVFAIANLQVHGTRIVYNDLMAQEQPTEPDAPAAPSDDAQPEEVVEAQPQSTPAPAIDKRASEKKVGSLSMNQIMVIVALVMGPYIGIQCWGEISGKIFAAGGVIYLVQEIMGYSKYKKASTSNQEMYASLDPETTDAQMEAFTYAEQQEKTAADALKTKSTAVMTFATATTIAAIAALIEGIADFAGWVTGYNSSCFVNNKNQNDFQHYANIPVTPIKGESISQYYARADELNDFYFGRKYQSNVAFSIEKDSLFNSQVSKEEQSSLLKVIYAASKITLDAIFPTATAKSSENKAKSTGPLSGMGVLAATAGTIMAIVATTEAPFLSTILSNGFARAATFGVLAGFQFAAKAEIDKGMDKLNDNAKVYAELRQRIVSALGARQRFAGINGVQNATQNGLSGYQAIRDDMNTPTDGAICLTGNAGEKRVDQNCACAKNNTCAKASFNAVGLQGQTLPAFFGSSLNNLGSGATSLFAGNTTAANSQFAQMGQNAAKLRKLHSDLKIKADKIIKDKSKNKANFDKYEEQAEKRLAKLAPILMNKLTGEQQALLTGTSTGVKENSAQDLLKKQDLKSIAESIQATAKDKDATASAGVFKFDFGDEEEAASTEQQVALNQGDALGDFVTNESDISDRPSENIFKIITVRYFKSAYPRFFEEENRLE